MYSGNTRRAPPRLLHYRREGNSGQKRGLIEMLVGPVNRHLLRPPEGGDWSDLQLLITTILVAVTHWVCRLVVRGNPFANSVLLLSEIWLVMWLFLAHSLKGLTWLTFEAEALVRRLTSLWKRARICRRIAWKRLRRRWKQIRNRDA